MFIPAWLLVIALGVAAWWYFKGRELALKPVPVVDFDEDAKRFTIDGKWAIIIEVLDYDIYIKETVTDGRTITLRNVIGGNKVYLTVFDVDNEEDESGFVHIKPLHKAIPEANFKNITDVTKEFKAGIKE
ncbi:hypothetical protein ACNASG_21215 [Klebsiella pneumoniae]|uniref:hypothetical protein n=1 Tax=Klebsiella pneumoniae TaxID=573 RepID=UPI003A4D3625|nr:hypothetical protein [Klebsiella pneumoniae]